MRKPPSHPSTHKPRGSFDKLRDILSPKIVAILLSIATAVTVFSESGCHVQDESAEFTDHQAWHELRDIVSKLNLFANSIHFDSFSGKITIKILAIGFEREFSYAELKDGRLEFPGEAKAPHKITIKKGTQEISFEASDGRTVPQKPIITH